MFLVCFCLLDVWISTIVVLFDVQCSCMITRHASHRSPLNLNFRPQTLNHTLHVTFYTSHVTHHTSHRSPQIFNVKPETLNPKP